MGRASQIARAVRDASSVACIDTDPATIRIPAVTMSVYRRATHGGNQRPSGQRGQPPHAEPRFGRFARRLTPVEPPPTMTSARGPSQPSRPRGELMALDQLTAEPTELLRTMIRNACVNDDTVGS